MNKRQRKKNMKHYEQLFKAEMTKKFGESPLENISIKAKELKMSYYAKGERQLSDNK